MSRPIRTVLFSTLYPSSVRPLLGIFVETRLRALLAAGGIETKVVAPVGWFPSTSVGHAKYAALAATPERERHNEIDVLHPRYVAVPKVGMSSAPLLLALGALPTLRRLRAEGYDFDLIDAHYYYPDGVAAALLGRWLQRPVVVTARGSDVNLLPQYALPRLQIRWALRQVQASIGVSGALVERMRGLGADPARLHVMPNGVDLERFRPQAPALARRDLGIDGDPVLLFVGNLHEHKGQRLAVEAFERVLRRWPQARLYFVGDGPDRSALEREIRSRGLAERVNMVGAVPNDALAPWYSAADALILASSREGWPNVLLEAMACGTPVVATAVGGVPEIVAAPPAGRLVTERSADALAREITQLLSEPIDRSAVRQYAEGFGWERTSQSQLHLFERLLQQPAPGLPRAASA